MMLFSFLCIITLTISLGILPLLFGKRNTMTLAFSSATFSSSIWILSVFLALNSSQPLFWSRFAFTSSCLIPVSLLIFILHYPVSINRLSRMQWFLIGIVPACLFFSSFTSLIVKGVITPGKLIYGPGYPVFGLYDIGYTLVLIPFRFEEFLFIKVLANFGFNTFF